MEYVIGIALGLLSFVPVIVVFATVQWLRYWMTIRNEVSQRGGKLRRIEPSWLFSVVVRGFRSGRRLRFEWVDKMAQRRRSECIILHWGPESLITRGEVIWMNDAALRDAQ